MKQINKNSVPALAVKSDSYILHKKPNNFAFDGVKPFTIEAFFIVINDETSVIYGQENGFSFGLNNKKLYFSLNGFGSISSPDNIILEKNAVYFGAVTFNGNELSLYINGLKMATKKKDGNVTPSTSNYTIGKYFSGYVLTVRLFSRALSDSELLTDNANPLQTSSNCEMWADFTTAQYKDISTNALPFWRTGSYAKCTDVVACTVVKGKSAYKKATKLSLGSSYTLTGKCLPDLYAAKSGCIFSAGVNGKKLFSISLWEKGTDSCLAFVTPAGTVIGSIVVDPKRWCDFALVLTAGKAALYVNGTLDIMANFNYTQTDSLECVIGAEYYQTTPSYTNAFNGYIDHFAEFGKALTIEEINAYAENPPYIFADSIKSLMVFGWGEAKELIANTPLKCAGDGFFTFVSGTNPQNSPKGICLNIPETEDPQYNSLSDDDKWVIDLIVSVAQTTFSQLLGQKKSASANPKEIPVERRLGPTILNKNPELVRFSRDGTPAPSGIPTETQEQVGYFLRGNRNGYIRLYNTAAEANVPTTFFSCGSITEFLSKHWVAIVAGVAIIGTLVAAVILICKECGKKRKAPNGELTVESISLNHNGNAKTGSIHFHSGIKYDEPQSMSYGVVSGAISAQGVIIPSLLSNAYIDVTLKYKPKQSTGDFSGKLKMDTTIEEERFCDNSEASFTISPNNEKTVRLDLKNIKLTAWSKKDISFILSCDKSTPQFLINCKMTMHSLSALPTAPWNNYVGQAYSKTQSGYVHTDLLDIAMNATSVYNDSSAEASANGFSTDDDKKIKAFISALNNCERFSYNTIEGGAPKYLDVGGAFKFIKFETHWRATSGVYYLNCADCATIISSFAALNGIVCPMTIIRSVFNPSGFLCNLIQAISAEKPLKWHLPFEKMPGEGMFSFHQVNVTHDTCVSTASGIYDACLKVDGGDYPGLNKEKTAHQPQGLLSAANGDPFVNVPTTAPYKGMCYRERLVAHGQSASFFMARFFVPGLSNVVTIPHAERNELVQLILEQYELNDGTLKPAPTNYKELTLDDIENLQLLSHTIENETEESFDILYNGEPHTLIRYKCTQGWTPALLLAHVMSYISSVPKPLEDKELFEKGFQFGEQLLVGAKNGQVLSLRGSNATELYNAVLTSIKV